MTNVRNEPDNQATDAFTKDFFAEWMEAIRDVAEYELREAAEDFEYDTSRIDFEKAKADLIELSDSI